jgi:FAD dependent oxidoreductase TIGR03364
VRLLSPAETLRLSPAAEPTGLLGSLHSADECRVDPRQAIERAARFLDTAGEVDCHFATTVTDVADGGLRTSDGRQFAAREIAICSGADFARLFPETHRSAGLVRCKLQMLRTVAPGPGWKLGPHLASGLTLRHYEAFAACPSRAQLERRIAEQAPELDRYGIHVMMSQALDGQVVLGDSHEYDAAIEPFDKSEIEELILREVRKVFRLPTWQIEQRWSGIYAKIPGLAYLVTSPPSHPHVRIVNGFGGAGMSLSLAVTDQVVDSMLSAATGS